MSASFLKILKHKNIFVESFERTILFIPMTQLEAIIKEGWLKKPGSLNPSNWKKRYIVIRGNELGHFDSPPTFNSSNQCKEYYVVSRVLMREDRKIPHTFAVIDSKGKTHIYRATSAFEKDEWMLALVKSSTCGRSTIIPFLSTTEKSRARADTEHPLSKTMKEIPARPRAQTEWMYTTSPEVRAPNHHGANPDWATLRYRGTSERPRLPRPTEAPIQSETSVTSSELHIDRNHVHQGRPNVRSPPLPSPTLFPPKASTQYYPDLGLPSHPLHQEKQPLSMEKPPAYPELHHFLTLRNTNSTRSREAEEERLIQERMNAHATMRNGARYSSVHGIEPSFGR
ncbi:serine/threonine protein kinase [Planoprotostelium fungivorum]|uniref:Serine/threonine protein kinase n=1 Tax=Planoprotostelium fungivorum TaxID=1890364 RepID=A0A2P6NF05_9EUKA|nr:serine/threonine protein kinase [Planoprotostelium fungivorum]